MAQKQVGFLAAATCTAVVAKAVELPTSFAGALGLAVFGVCVGVTSFLKVEVPKPKKKAKKLSKKEKRDLAAANAPPVEEEVEDAAKLAKAAKKRAKDRARKEAKRAAKAEADVAEKKAEKKAAAVVEPVVVEKKLTKEQAKKKKQKEKAKAKKAAAKNEAAAPAAAAAAAPVTSPFSPAAESWEEVKKYKGKKKVEEVVLDSSAPAHEIHFFVERKHFGLIIGPGGANLRLLTEATGTEIEMPREGGMQHEVVITGSVEGCNKAKKNIQQLVAKGYCDITHAGTVDSQIFIPDNKRGIVIGSKGANIKMLQEKLSVKINFPEKGSEDNVTIVGDSKNVKACEAAVKQLMEQGFCPITHANHMQVHVEVARDMLKNLIGTGGAVIKGLQQTHNVQITIPSDKSDAVVIVTLLGEPEGLAGCRAQMDVLLAPPPPTVISAEWTQAASAVHVGVW